MTSQREALKSIDAKFARAFKRAGIADAGLYWPADGSEPYQCTLLVNRNVQAYNEVGGLEVIQNYVEVTAFFSEIVQRPRKGALFLINNNTEEFQVERITAADESRVVCLCLIA